MVDVCAKCDLGSMRKRLNVRTGQVTPTDRCVCGGKLVRKTLHEWLHGKTKGQSS